MSGHGVSDRATDPDVAARIVVDPDVRHDGATTRVLVTNDDGIESPGIVTLAHALADRFDVTVAAPDRDWSGSGTGIGRFEPSAGVTMRQADVGLTNAFAIDGPPGLAVLAAALGAFGPPFDVVVSGINAGVNTGQSVIHSGTVGAALTARTMGSHGVAVSAVPGDPWHWDTAATLAVAAVDWITQACPAATAINLNVPALPIDDLRGLRAATLDRFGYFRVATAGDDRIEFEVTSHDSGDDDPVDDQTDTALLRADWATITALGTLVSADGVLPDDLAELWPGRRAG